MSEKKFIVTVRMNATFISCKKVLPAHKKTISSTFYTDIIPDASSREKFAQTFKDEYNSSPVDDYIIESITQDGFDEVSEVAEISFKEIMNAIDAYKSNGGDK